jgi:hypothetical protein
LPAEVPTWSLPFDCAPVPAVATKSSLPLVDQSQAKERPGKAHASLTFG